MDHADIMQHSMNQVDKMTDALSEITAAISKKTKRENNKISKNAEENIKKILKD